MLCVMGNDSFYDKEGRKGIALRCESIALIIRA